MDNYTKIEKINDDRLVGYTQRARNGITQQFYTGRDARDWDRYRLENVPGARSIEIHLKPDTINIEPPEKHWYAELIDGEWWWVNGCGVCNGGPRDYHTYIECEKHDVCKSCGCSRSSLKETPCGGLSGWQCVPCADQEHERIKSDALAKMPKEFREWNYRGVSDIKCPYCDYKIDDEWDLDLDIDLDTELECDRCDNTFLVIGQQHVTWSMYRKNDQ